MKKKHDNRIGLVTKKNPCTLNSVHTKVLPDWRWLNGPVKSNKLPESENQKISSMVTSEKKLSFIGSKIMIRGEISPKLEIRIFVIFDHKSPYIFLRGKDFISNF